jgi:protein tyrosine phosphatase (PTP) superfamily phosphohydrolase (DUF442 family)
MKTADIEKIRNFYQIDKNTATAGQPTIDEFSVIKQNKFDLIINLATKDSPDAINNEAELVNNLGLDYVHIPVKFKAPTLSDLLQFFETMEQNRNKRVFVHCALNWRVASFIFLYRTIKDNVPITKAMQDLHCVWKPDDNWQVFIDGILARYNVYNRTT